jgi:hypothetical protein
MASTSNIFEQLRELTRIVSIAGPKDWPILSLKAVSKSKSPYAGVFRVLRDKPQLTETGVFREAFPVEVASGNDIAAQQLSHQRSEVRYRKIKSRLKTRLLNTLFVLDIANAGYSIYSQTLFLVNRSVFLCRVLRVLGTRELSASIARNGLPKAMTIEEWSCAMEFLVILRSDAARRGATKAHRVYVAQWEHCQKLLDAEQRAEICIENLQLAFAKSGEEKPEHAKDAMKGAEIVGNLSKEFPSFKLSFIAIRLHALATQLQMNYFDTVKVCDRAFVLLEQYPVFSNHARNSEYAFMGLLSSVQGRIGEAVPRYIDLCEKHFDKEKDNWFNFKEFQYLHLMQTLAFQDANLVVQNVLLNPRYVIQTEVMRDRWSLFRLYGEFTTGSRVPILKFDDFTILVPSFAADKGGLNMAMILLHILLLAERKQFGELRDRIEFIRGYRKRHLKGPDNSQMNRFFKMLELIETCDLNYSKIVRKSRVLLEELKKSEECEPIQGEQILPLSWIWNRLMECIHEYHPINTRMS